MIGGRGLLFQGLEEVGLLTRVRRVTPEDAVTIHAALRKHAENEKLLKWKEVLPSIRKAFAKLALAPDGELVLAEEASRDDGAYRVAASLLITVVEEAWYPSEDLYVLTEDLKRCLILSHQDVIFYSVR